MKDKTEWDLFLMNELSISWLFISERKVILLLVNKQETELLLLSEWETELLLASKLKTELLFSSEWKTRLLLTSELRARLRESYFVNFEREIFFLLIKIIDFDKEWAIIIKIKEEKQDENIMLKININDVMMKL